MADRDNIIRMAREAGAPDWWSGANDSNCPGARWLPAFAELVIADAVAAATAPLQARIAAMEGMQVPTVEDIESQHWAQVDGATAWHLVHRHAEDWAHTARLMHAWRDAAVAAAVEAEREAIRARGQRG